MQANCWTWHAPREDVDQMQLEEGINIKHRRLCRGDIVQVMNNRFMISDTPDSGATLVLINTRAGVEYHDLEPNPHFRDTQTWIGADGRPTLYQDGKWRDPKKKQLFRLHEGEFILFIDSLREVTKLTAKACGEKPERARATEGEVANYVIGEARNRGDRYSTRKWCFHALKELGCQEQIDQFNATFPNLHHI